MIPAIGIMVGLYILARTAEMMDLPRSAVRILAGIAAITAVFSIASLLLSSLEVSSLIPPLPKP